MTQATTEPASSAAGTAWDLGELYPGPDDPRIEADLAAAGERARRFETTYRDRIAALDATQAGTLLEAVTELEALSEQMDRPAVYAALLHAARTDVPRHGALLARTQEALTEINEHLLFFDLEWVRVPDADARALLADPALTRYAHWLERRLVRKPHLLSEPEEKVLDRKAITGRTAFVRLFEETTAAMRFPVTVDGDTRSMGMQEILARLYDPDRGVRKAAAAGLSHGLRENSRLLTFLFNTLVLDHQVDTRMRRYAGPMSARNIANEISDEVVEALMTATERHFPLVQRYYRLKGKLLGLDRVADYDRYAPLPADLPECDWPSARAIVEESYAAFSPQAGEVVRAFFEGRWIDAEPRPGKRGGAFCSSAVPSLHPYVLMSYTDRLRDVMTLAHELGHGLHTYLSRGRGYLQCDTPLTTAETASVFGEMLTFRRLLERHPEPRRRLALLCGKLEDAFATVFRQVVLTRFELALHRARAEKGELSADAVNALWMESNRAMFADAVALTDGYSWWWSYVGHFVRSPFYCYAYAFGELLVLALFRKYEQEGAGFVPRYLELLAAGGSEAPHVLLARLGVDVTDPSFWELGLRLLGDMVGEAERLAAQVGPGAG
jgi:oligoendopeptidase F